MHNHWFTIRNYWNVNSDKLIGSKITQAFTFQKNECSFVVLSGRDRYRVNYSGNSELPYLYLTDRLNIPKRRVQLFEQIEGNIITGIEMVPGDRVLQWQLDNDSRIYFEFYGGKPNIYFADAQNEVIDSFKDYDRSSVLNFREFSGIPYPLPDDFKTRFLEGFESNAKKSISNILTQILPHWISLLSREVLYQMGLEDSFQGLDLSESKRKELAKIVQDLYAEMANSDAFLSTIPDPAFSLIELKHDSLHEWDLRLPIEEAYPKYIGMFYRGRDFREQLKRLRQSLGNRLEREQRKVEKQETDLQEYASPEHYRKLGDLLMANLHNISAGKKSAELDDIIGGSGQLTVKLDPRLSPVENAQKYYEKAKKAKRGKTRLQQQIDETREKLKSVQKLFDQLNAVENLADLDRLSKETEQLGVTLKHSRGTPEPETRLPYTEYTSPDGWRVLVGRGARDNDELTFHIANKDDFWFHAENVPGSHVIAVNDNKNLEKPPAATLKFAASLAAGYSQAKHSNLVPVIYTKRKYVTKPRGAGPGLVRYQFENSVIVEPKRAQEN